MKMSELPPCTECGRQVCLPCVAANDNSPDEFVVAACDTLLLNPVHHSRMSIALNNLDISRRSVPDRILDAIISYEGAIFDPDGCYFILNDDDIDEAFNNDGTFRWISDYIKYGRQPPRRIPQRRLLPRLRLIDLFFQIEYPNIARQFRR